MHILPNVRSTETKLVFSACSKNSLNSDLSLVLSSCVSRKSSTIKMSWSMSVVTLCIIARSESSFSCAYPSWLKAFSTEPENMFLLKFVKLVFPQARLTSPTTTATVKSLSAEPCDHVFLCVTPIALLDEPELSLRRNAIQKRVAAFT